ncbi:MAG: N-acetyl sugar amidotransferase [Gammaproteobacteria bacterium]|nr:N-acetyl sugar amidotransferase [Gammaproteobacteria bacterium]
MEHKNTQLKYNLPTTVIFCKKCVISNQRPRITFDKHGVCSACNYAAYKSQIDWSEREVELISMLKRFKRTDGGYEVLVPSSGGKDSAYIAHELKHKYGMNVLTVTWAPHLYTDIGFQNFQNMMHVGGVDNILATPNGIVHRKLTKLFFELLGDPFQPFIYGQTNYPLQIAVKFGIPLIMYGENGEVEYGGDMKNAFRPTRDYKVDHLKHYFSGISPLDLLKLNILENEIKTYLAPSVEELDKLQCEIHFYGYYKKWVPQENYYYCTEHTGFKPNIERSEGTYSKYASLDDKIDGFHYYLSFIKFGLGRATSDAAHEIRDAHLTREEGVQLVDKFDGEFPAKYFKTFLQYCNISETYFWEVIESWRSPHLWKKVNNEWKLRHTIAQTGADDFDEMMIAAAVNEKYRPG